MNLSLNEVEATAKRATRGGGYPWGLAEEAAKAVRWLCSNDIDGCTALAEVLTRFEGTVFPDRVPVAGRAEWYAPGGVLCPLSAGAALADRGLDLTDRDIRMAPVATPILLVHFAALAAGQLRNTVTVIWGDCTAVTDGARVCITGQIVAEAQNVTLRRGGQPGLPRQQTSRATPDQTAWETLNLFAHRTYAPATEESRRLGAGAGLTDTD